MMTRHEMKEADVKTDIVLEIRGVKYPVSIDGRGTFEATADGQVYRARSLDELKVTLSAATKDSGRLSIRFGRVQPSGEIRYGTATGMHAVQRSLLVKWDDGHRETIRSYDAGRLLPVLDQAQSAEWAALWAAAQDANAAVEAFRETHRLNLWQAAVKVLNVTEENL